MTIQVAEIVVAVAEFVVGFLLLAFYALYVSGAGGQSASITTIFPTVLLPIAFLSFTFGVFSLLIAMLGLTSQPSAREVRQVYSEPSYVSPEIAQTSVPVSGVQKQAEPEAYSATAPPLVAELSRTVLQRTSSWSERVCAQCGREVEEYARFCDGCGSRLQRGEETRNEALFQHRSTS